MVNGIDRILNMEYIEFVLSTIMRLPWQHIFGIFDPKKGFDSYFRRQIDRKLANIAECDILLNH